jgi:Raf kinase inhibitor-like YbhB/YbcL family protein
MKKITFLLFIFILTGCATANTGLVTVSKSYQATSSPLIISNKTYMKLTSPNFSNGDFLPTNLTCLGEGTAPVLQIADVPTSTLTLALVVDDPDAPAGVFTHWLVWNIERSTTTINAANLPDKAIVGVNSAGANKYFPPCPPSGTHHYYFRLYALDQKLNLSAKSSVKQLLKAMTGHVVDEAVLMGKFERKN